MKILLSIPNSGFGGAENQLLLLAKGLRDKGNDIYLCNLDKEGLFTKRAIDNGFKCKIIKRRFRFDIFRLIKYIVFIHKNKFNAIVSFTSSANNLTRIAKILDPFTKFFHIACERGRDLDKLSFGNWIDSKLANISNLIICNSTIQRDKLISIEKIKPKKVHVVFNGFDVDVIRDSQGIDLERYFNIPQKNKVVCSVGNLTAPKNIPMFLKVAEKVISENNKISFLYVGNGKDLNKYKYLAKEKGIDEKIFFVGRQEKILQILKSCDIFILTSKREGMPNVIIEAMAAKTPVISTKVDGVNDIITDNVNGCLIESEDSDEMKNKIFKILSNDDLRNLICKNAEKTVRHKFNKNIMVNSYEKHIKLNFIE